MIKVLSADKIKERTKKRQSEETEDFQEESKDTSATTRKTYLPAVSVAEKNNRISSVKYARMPALEIDPSRCRPWKYHNRDLAWLSTDRCADLIGSITRNGQREPGMVRKIDQEKNPDPDHDFEIIYGVRRWYSVSKVHGKKFLAIITEDDDKKCMIHMHSENADSQDITEFERAYSFKVQFESGLFSNQRVMAKELGVSQGLISRMIRAASIFDYKFIRDIFPHKLEISVREAHKLYDLLSNEKHLSEIKNRAKELCREKKSDGKKSTKEIFAYLNGAAGTKSSGKKEIVLYEKNGKKLISLQKEKSGSFFIKCASQVKQMNKDDLKKIFGEVVENYV